MSASSNSANTTAIKARLNNGETRRFALAPTATWADLRDKIAGVFRLDKDQFSVNYADEDGDNVVVSTDGEVAELLNFNKTVRLNVSAPGTAAAPAAESSAESDTETMDVEQPAAEPAAQPAASTSASTDSPFEGVVEEVDSDEDEEPIPSHLKGKGKASDEPEAATTATTATTTATTTTTTTTTTAPKRTSDDVRAELESLRKAFNERNQDLFEQFGTLNRELVALAAQEIAEAHRKWAEERSKIFEQRRQEWIKARNEAVERQRKEAAAQAAAQEKRRKEWIERQQKCQQQCGHQHQRGLFAQPQARYVYAVAGEDDDDDDDDDAFDFLSHFGNQAQVNRLFGLLHSF